VTRTTTVRDYKKPRRSQLDTGRVRDIAVGFAAGAVAVGALALYMRAGGEAEALTARPEPRPAAVAEQSASAAPDAPAQFDFYEMLPKFEVVVPEREREVRRDLPAAPVERPGVYVLQAGSFRNVQDAERVRAQLAVQGIEAKVQRVAVDTDVWHRVRIGPVADLADLNRLRARLQRNNIDALVIRVGD
jgi:cell division protein FtsN